MITTHPTFQNAQDISEIIKPLQKLNISYFAHSHIENGSLSGLCSHPEFYRHYVNNHYYNDDIHMASDNTLGNFIIWDSIELGEKGSQMSQEAIAHGIDHTFTIIEKKQNSSDYYHFSTHLASKSFNQVYLANYDLLNLFISYFKKCVNQSPELSKAYDFKHCLDKNNERVIIKDIHELNLSEVTKSEFLLQIKVLAISKREEECLYYTVRGKTAKEIAQILGLSFRTVETHLEKAKVKFNVATKSQLIEKWFDLYRHEDSSL